MDSVGDLQPHAIGCLFHKCVTGNKEISADLDRHLLQPHNYNIKTAGRTSTPDLLDLRDRLHFVTPGAIWMRLKSDP